MPKIDADRAYRRCIAQADSNSIRIIVGKIIEVDRAIHVASVVKNDTAQILHDAKWKTHLRIQDEELPSPTGSVMLTQPV